MRRPLRILSLALLPVLAAGCPGIVADTPDDGGIGGAAAPSGMGGAGHGGKGAGPTGGTGAVVAPGSGGVGGGSTARGAAGTKGSGSGGAGTAGSGAASGVGGQKASSSGGATGVGGAGMTGAGGVKGSGGATATGGAKGSGGASASGGKVGSGGSVGSGGAGSGGARGSGGAGTASGGAGGGPSSGSGGAGGGSGAGNPNGSCSTGVPARGQPANTSNPTTVVGTGTEASCTFSALQTAVTKGGVITFDCGPDPVTIAVTATMSLPINKNTVIDGGNKITLDGGKAVQILSFKSPDYKANDNGLTVQHITFANGKKTPTVAIPTAPAPCSQGWNDGQGGAIYIRDGALTVIDAIFTGNQAAPLGPDTGGGAIYSLGSKAGVFIVGSTFTNNSGSNAGAVGCLQSGLEIYNSLFKNNTATGHDANSNDPDSCDAINNDQNEIGSGGNGGAVYSDGESVNVLLCGDAILNNAAGTKAFGGGLFFTSNDYGGTLTIADTTMTGNTGGHWTQVKSGSVDDVGTAVGTNTKSITLKSSMLQGL